MSLIIDIEKAIEDRRKKSLPRSCRYCQAVFKPRRIDQIYCSSKCVKEYWEVVNPGRREQIAKEKLM